MDIKEFQANSLGAQLNDNFIHDLVWIFKDLYYSTHQVDYGEGWVDSTCNYLDKMNITYPLMNVHILFTLGIAQHRNLPDYWFQVKHYGYLLLRYPFADKDAKKSDFQSVLSSLQEELGKLDFENFDLADHLIAKGNIIFMFYYLPPKHNIAKLRRAATEKEVEQWILDHWDSFSDCPQFWEGDVLTTQDDALDDYTHTDEYVYDADDDKRWYLENFVLSKFNFYWRTIAVMLDNEHVVDKN